MAYIIQHVHVQHNTHRGYTHHTMRHTQHDTQHTAKDKDETRGGARSSRPQVLRSRGQAAQFVMRLVRDRRSAAPLLPVLTARFEEFMAVRGVAAPDAAAVNDDDDDDEEEEEEEEEDVAEEEDEEEDEAENPGGA